MFPWISINYCTYHCYAGVGTCCYRWGSRTDKIMKVYNKFDKLSPTKERQSKIKKLKTILDQKKTERQHLASKSESILEMLNIDLATLSLKFEREDVACLLYTSPSPRDLSTSRMPSSA